MKFLLVAALSMGITTSAFSACSATSPQDCIEEKDCLKLNESSAQKFSFDDKRAVKCGPAAASDISDCDKVVNNGRSAKPVIVDDKKAGAAATTVAPK
jgi:hypothetical protein